MFLIVSCGALIAFSKDNFLVAVLLSAMSLCLTLMYTLLLAPDVAMTECCVGVFAGTILFVSTSKNLGHVGSSVLNGYTKGQKILVAMLFFCICVVLICICFWIFIPFAGTSVASVAYNQIAYNTMYVPNVVTAILTSFRGFDTLGELTLIFVAGFGVYSILLNDEEIKD